MKYLNTLLNNHKEKTREGDKEIEEGFFTRKHKGKIKGEAN